MADNKIPLFRIPFLVLCMILDHYSVYEIIQLSLCSKRSLQVAKKSWKKKEVINAALYAQSTPRVQLEIPGRFTSAYYRFFICSTKNLRFRQVHNIRVGDAVVPSIHKDNERVTYWDDKIFGIEQFVRHTKDLFDVSISLIELGKQENPNDPIRIIDAIKNSQVSVKNCGFFSMNSMDDCLKYFLDNIEITGNMWIYGKPTEQFSHDWNIQLDGLHVSSYLSFTFRNLMNIDCRFLDLCSSSLTSKDLNQFLRHWQNGGHPRIEFLSLRINSIDQEIITSGIDTVSQPQRLWRQYEGMNNSKVVQIGGIDIRRKDGTTGTIFIYTNTFEFGVDPKVIR
ncbi:unnamed protein product [Caenorhabditis brenneri]